MVPPVNTPFCTASRSNVTMAEAQTLSQTNCIYDWLQTITTPPCQKDQSRPSVRPNLRKPQLQRSSKDDWLRRSDPFNSSDDRLLHYFSGVDHGRSPIATHTNQYYIVEDKDEHNPYAKRPRRRTRADKYVLDNNQQQDTIDPRLQKDLPKKSSKRKRQESSGTLLLHRYNADNVLSNRLTLKPISYVGLFSKGRASISRAKSKQDRFYLGHKSPHQDFDHHSASIDQGSHQKRRKIKDVLSAKSYRALYEETPSKLIFQSGLSPRNVSTHTCSESIQNSKARIEPPLHPSVETSPSHSRCNILGTPPRRMSLNTGSRHSLMRTHSTRSRSPEPVQDCSRRLARDEMISELRQDLAANHDVHIGDTTNLHDTANNRKVLPDTTVHHQSGTRKTKQGSDNLLCDLDELVQKWKANMQQSDVGLMSKNDTENGVNPKAISEEANVLGIYKKFKDIVYEGETKTDGDLEVDINYQSGYLDDGQNPVTKSLEEAEAVRVCVYTAGSSMRNALAVSGSPNPVHRQPRSVATRCFTQPTAAPQSLRMVTAPLQSLYEQQIKDVQIVMTRDMPSSISPTCKRNIVTRSSFHSHAGIYTINTSPYLLDRFTPRTATSVSSRIGDITEKGRLSKDSVLHNLNARLACQSLYGSPSNFEPHPISRTEWDTPQTKLADPENKYTTSTIISEQLRSDSHIGQDSFSRTNDLITEHESRNFWTPQKLY